MEPPVSVYAHTRTHTHMCKHTCTHHSLGKLGSPEAPLVLHNLPGERWVHYPHPRLAQLHTRVLTGITHTHTGTRVCRRDANMNGERWRGNQPLLSPVATAQAS